IASIAGRSRPRESRLDVALRRFGLTAVGNRNHRRFNRVRRLTMITRKRLLLLCILATMVAGFVLYPRLEAATRPTAKTTTDNTQQGSTGRPGAGADSGTGGRGNRGSGPVAVVTAVAVAENVPVTKDAVGFVEPIATVAVRPRMDGVIVEQQ